MSAADFFKGFLAIWFAGFGLVVSYGILTRRINVAGALTVDGRGFSPSRLQVLVVTVSGAVAYIVACLDAHRMVAIQNEFVALFALSHGSYLAPKVYRSLLQK